MDSARDQGRTPSGGAGHKGPNIGVGSEHQGSRSSEQRAGTTALLSEPIDATLRREGHNGPRNGNRQPDRSWPGVNSETRRGKRNRLLNIGPRTRLPRRPNPVLMAGGSDREVLPSLLDGDPLQLGHLFH